MRTSTSAASAQVIAHVAVLIVDTARAELLRRPVKGMTGRIDIEVCAPDLDDQGRRLAILAIEVAGTDKEIDIAQNTLTIRCSPWSPYGWSGTRRRATSQLRDDEEG